MANSRGPLPLLLLGLLVSPAFLQQHPCDVIRSTSTPGSFSLDVSPQTYKPGEIYTVTVSGADNGTSVLLQALSGDGRSDGLWETETEAVSCGASEYLVQKNISGHGARTRWTSPSNANAAAVHIRAFVTFANGTTLLQSQTLTRDLTTGFMTPAPSTATRTASGAHQPTLFSNSTGGRFNATIMTHNWASSHQQHQVPYNSASTSQIRSVLLAAFQFLPIFLGFKLLS
ncbi:placenta-expressed transcript 1 protein-like [Paroedura picta]|uniref:placenta-expressed transcript 1 protein-like n=1 Tax=Paroedura picta TaxID=143630 RepID=UPI004057B6BC